MENNLKALVITGPTATGKTALAVRLARKFGGEIISADSRQVYCRLDLGTGKDLAEYGEIPHHLIDIADPATETFHLAAFMTAVYAAMASCRDRGKRPIVCGGSALYIASLLHDYRLDTGDGEAFTPPFAVDFLTLGVLYPRETVRRRIAERLDARLSAGLIEEVRQLHDLHGVSYEKLEYFGLEYREVAQFLQGRCTEKEMRETLLNRIRQFAKRQDIFFRKIERGGTLIHWLPEGDPAQAEALWTRFLCGETLPPPAFRINEIHYGPRSQ